MPNPLNSEKYKVIVRFDAQSYNGRGYYELDTGSLEKTQQVVQQLRERGLQWETWLKEVTPSLAQKTICLHFKPVQTQNCRGEFWGKFLKVFQRSLGFTSDNFDLQHNDSTDVVTLAFKEGPELKSQMEDALVKLNNLSTSNQVAKLLKENKDFKLDFQENSLDWREQTNVLWHVELDIRKSWKEPAATTGAPNEPYWLTRAHPVFEVAEETIQSNGVAEVSALRYLNRPDENPTTP